MMRLKALLWWGVGIALLYLLVWHKQCDCDEVDIALNYTCSVLEWKYSRINHFCDNRKDWKEISRFIEHSRFSNFRPIEFWGTKLILCGDDADVDDLNDPKLVFLRTTQDTSRAIYDGALTDIRFGLLDFKKLQTNDVGKENRKVTKDSTSISVDYTLDYNEICTDALREFQESIYFDSTFYLDNKTSVYKLLSKNHRSPLASIRYEDYGKRLYFKVHY